MDFFMMMLAGAGSVLVLQAIFMFGMLVIEEEQKKDENMLENRGKDNG